VFRLLRGLDARDSPLVPVQAVYGEGARPTAEMEAAFFAGLRLPNGTFKTTSDRRLDDLNEHIARHLRPGHVRAKDVAVSSGITTVEWYENLTARGFTCEMTATDIQVRARLIQCSGGLTVLTDPSEYVMEVDVCGFAFRPDQAGRRERVLYGIPLRIATRPRLRAALTKTTRDVDLVSPRLSRNPNIRVGEEDLDRAIAGEWDVVRAANILNLGYFSEDVLERMVTNLARAVRPSGLLAICRTLRGSGNHGSIFQRTDTGLDPLDDVGNGSEIARLARRVSL
jgi:hypothetical protein